MSFHPDITRKDDVTLALDAANAAIRVASKQLTGNAGTVEIPNADGTSTIMGVGAGDTGVAAWVGDTTPPGKPLGITAESHNGAIWVSWDGTLDGGVPADFDHVQFTAVDGSKTVDMGQLRAAGKVTAAELTAGDTVTITAIAYDGAHDAQGNSTPNASVPSDPVTVVVQSAVDAASVQKAQDDAQSALDKAGQAVDTADGKNKIFSSASEPSHTGIVSGDMWFQLDSNKNVSGIKVWNGSAFTDMVLLANKLLVASSVGTTQIADNAIVTGKIAANAITAIKIAAQTITGDKLDVGSVAAAIVRSNQFVTDDGLKGFDSDNGYWIKDADGNYLFHANTDGNIELQDAVMKGGDVIIGDPSYGQIHLRVNSNNVGTIDFTNDDGVGGTLQSYSYDNEVTLVLDAGALNFLKFIYDETTHKRWALFEGTIYADSLDNLPTDLRLGSEKGSIAFAGGVRYTYDGEGSWQEYDTGWINIGYGDGYEAAPFGNSPRIRVSGGLVFVQGVSSRKSGSVTNGDTPFGLIPASYRPREITYATVNGQAERSVNIQVNVSGTTNVKGTPGGDYVACDGCWWALD